MNQHTFKNIAVAAQVDSPKSSRFVRVRKRTLQEFTAPTKQPSTSPAPNPPPIGVDRVACGAIVLPVSAGARRLGNVSSNAQQPQVLKQFVTVIALIRDQFLNGIALGFHLFDVLGCCYKRLFNRFGVASVCWLDRHSHYGARLQIHRMFRLMSQVRAAIFHLGNACIGIVRMSPVLIRSFLGPLAVQAGQLFSRWRGDPRCLRQSHQKCLITLTRIAPHNATQRRIRFQSRSINSYRLAVDQTRFGKPLQNPGEYRLMRFKVDQPPRSRNRRMIRGASSSSNPKNASTLSESAARQAIPRSYSISSKNPSIKSRKYRP